MSTIAAMTRMVGEHLYERAPIKVVSDIATITITKIEFGDDFIRGTFHWGVTLGLIAPREKITIAIPDEEVSYHGESIVRAYMRKLCADVSVLLDTVANPVR